MAGSFTNLNTKFCILSEKKKQLPLIWSFTTILSSLQCFWSLIKHFNSFILVTIFYVEIITEPLGMGFTSTLHNKDSWKQEKTLPQKNHKCKLWFWLPSWFLVALPKYICIDMYVYISIGKGFHWQIPRFELV